MADKGQQAFAGMDEERQRDVAREGSHASHEKGNAHEFDREEAAEAGRKGAQARQMAHAARETVGTAEMNSARDERDSEGEDRSDGGEVAMETESVPSGERAKKTRGGTHDQHVTAGKKGGSRIRELIELGYKYEQEHGIGPGRNERSKMAAERRASKPSRKGGGAESEATRGETGDEAE